MNNEQLQTLSLKAAYSFGVQRGLEREVNEIRNMVIEWDSSHIGHGASSGVRPGGTSA